MSPVSETARVIPLRRHTCEIEDTLQLRSLATEAQSGLRRLASFVGAVVALVVGLALNWAVLRRFGLAYAVVSAYLLPPFVLFAALGAERLVPHD